MFVGSVLIVYEIFTGYRDEVVRSIRNLSQVPQADVYSEILLKMQTKHVNGLLRQEKMMCKQVRSETEALYTTEPGKNHPTEILDAIASINAGGRPIWKPMQMQPMYRMHEFVTVNGSGRAKTNAYIADGIKDVGSDIFHRGVCLLSDNKMIIEQQGRIIEVIRDCFE